MDLPEPSAASAATHADPMLPVPYRVRKRHKEVDGTVTLELMPDAGGDALAFAPGQFTMLYVFGIGEIPISISGDPAERSTLVHTIRDVGRVSHALTQLRPGDLLGVRGPFGSPWPVPTARGDDVLIVAGGLGLAPLRPALYAVLAERLAFGRVSLLYGTRTNLDLLFKKELTDWRGRLDLEVEITVDRADASWRGEVGVVTALIDKVRFDPPQTTAFICGPEMMMRYTWHKLASKGIPLERLFVSVERNMHCGVGLCGHCQYGAHFACKDGPVLPVSALQPWLGKREI